MSKTGYVYTLNDPRTGEPKYVGATKNPKQRLRGHKNGSTNDDVMSWIGELESEGLDPEMMVVDVADLGELGQSELDVIERVTKEYELLNERENFGYTDTSGDRSSENLTKKTLVLSVPVAERLEEEKNQSEATEEALREYYGL
jgi:hypothetical protein